ncbi:MAG: PEP-CTERM sorting domain-containing protein [Planctomycetia bacterium]|jgi:hypothetical protein
MKQVWKNHPFFWSFLAIVAVTIGLAFPGHVAAVNVVMNFNSGSSDHPAFDSDGSKLIAMMAEVETYYQAMFEDSGTLTVNYLYDDLDGSTLATTLVTGVSNGHPSSCTIWVDTDVNWYFDPTPRDDSEFNMSQTLAGDISDPGSKYDGTVPDLLEYRYKGTNNGSVPAASGMDMWSTMIHEMGHGMGMNAFTAWSEVLFDDDYDFNSSLVWGNSMAADCYSGDGYHLAATSAMYPYSSSGQRDLMSATDIFAIISGGNWSGTVDLFRQDFYSIGTNANLNNANNWEGHKVPDSNDDVWIRHGNSTRPHTGNLTVNNMYIRQGSTVRTGAYRVRADQNCTVGYSSTNTAMAHAEAGGEFQVDGTLTVKDGSTVLMDATSLLDVGTLDIRDGASLTGAGTIDIENGFDLGGVMTTSGGDLTINSAVAIDFDAANGAAVYVTGGDLTCNAELTDAMSTYVEVGAGHCLTMTEGWQLYGGSATLYLNGGTTSSTRASIGGGKFRVAGILDVNHQGRFYCTAEFQSVADVRLTDSDDTLYLYDDTDIKASATFTGAGRLYMTSLGELTLRNGAEIDCRLHTNGGITVQADGVGEATVNSAFTMNSVAATKLFVEVDGDDSCDLLDVNAAVTLGGTLEIDFIDGYTPADGDSFTVIEYTSRSGTFGSITWDGAFDLIASYGATALTLTVDYGDSVTAVPEPSTLVLLLGAACGLGFFWRKRRS